MVMLGHALSDRELRAGRAATRQRHPAVARDRLRRGATELRWLTAWRDRNGRYGLTIHHVFDEGSEQFWDVAEFSPVDQDEYIGEGRRLGTVSTPEEILHAAQAFGAATTRWVNEGVIDDEYGDLRNAHTSTSSPDAGEPDHGGGA